MKPFEFKKLAEYRQEMDRLQKGLRKINERLTRLPKQYGFNSMNDFIDALLEAEKTTKDISRSGDSRTQRRKRAIITNDTNEKVNALIAAGKTGPEISEKLGISLPSVHNIKKKLGLVKKRT